MTDWDKDQAERLRKRTREHKDAAATIGVEEEIDPLSLPSRKEVHKNSIKKKKDRKGRPSLVVHLLFYLFILLVGLGVGIGIWMYWL